MLFEIYLILFCFGFLWADGEVQFGYKGDLGPEKWGNLNNAFQDCSNGKLQSPINIVKKDAFLNNKLGSLKREYNKANATLVNNGVNIGVCTMTISSSFHFNLLIVPTKKFS